MSTLPLELDQAAVSALLTTQMPDIADLPLVRTDPGWDNAVWRVGSELAVRLPQFAAAGEQLAKEITWLPSLVEALPLPTPQPIRVGRPSDRFPWPWYVTPWVPGEPADRTEVAPTSDAGIVLGGFLRALHVSAPPDAPSSADRGVPLQQLDEDFRQQLVHLADHVDAPAIARAWTGALDAAPFTGAPRWIHGDLHPANISVARGTVCGVLDFGEMCAGDPATDLAAAWIVLPSSQRDDFFEAYGGVDAMMRRRALGWAVRTALGLVKIGLAGAAGLPGGKVSWLACGRRALKDLVEAGPQ